jgi:hypothetical protein
MLSTPRSTARLPPLHPRRRRRHNVTFVVKQLGILFQKDLGQKTVEIAAAMTKYDPDESWQPVEDGL